MSGVVDAELVCRGKLTFQSPTHFELELESGERKAFSNSTYIFCHSLKDRSIAVYRRKPK